jgi:hypothetical protein
MVDTGKTSSTLLKGALFMLYHYFIVYVAHDVKSFIHRSVAAAPLFQCV